MHDVSSAKAGAPPATAWIVGRCDTRLWRISPDERLHREFRTQGINALRHQPDSVPGGAPGVVMVRADVLYDPVLLRALTETPGLALMLPEGDEAAGLHAPAETAAILADDLAAGRLTAKTVRRHGLAPSAPRDVASHYRVALRKREPPYLLRIRPERRRALEWRLFQGAYKGVTDIVTKYLWPVPAFWATQACVRLGLTPNMVTFTSLLLVIAAFHFFAQGQFAVGLVAAWLMTFLDTVDGKLARVTATPSRFGTFFDHGIDLIHPPFWYWAWMTGLEVRGAAPPDAALILAVIIGGYVLQRVEEGLFIARHGLEMHIWRRFDSLFRLVTARRNPNLIILTASLPLGRPDIGLAAVAWWTALCVGVHLVRLLQAEAARRAGPLESWLGR